jgi:hypothetical protein
LLNSFDNQSYYISISLAVKAAKERFSDIGNSEVKAQDIKLVKIAITDKISKENDNSDCNNVVYSDDSLSDSKLLPYKLLSDNKHSLDNDSLSDYKLLSNKLLYDV